MEHHCPSEQTLLSLVSSLCPVFLQAVPNIHLMALGADILLLNSGIPFSITACCANRKVSFLRSAILPLFMCIKLIQECVFPIKFKMQEFGEHYGVQDWPLHRHTTGKESTAETHTRERMKKNKSEIGCFLFHNSCKSWRLQRPSVSVIPDDPINSCRWAKGKGQAYRTVICESYFWVFSWWFLWTEYSISLFCDFSSNLCSPVCKLFWLSSLR